MSAFAQLTKTIAKEMSRDILGLFFAFAFPLFFLVFFGAFSRPSSIPATPVGLVADMQVPAVATLASELTKQPALSVVEVEVGGISRALKEGRVAAVIELRAEAGGPVSADMIQPDAPNPYVRAVLENAYVKVAQPQSAQELGTRIRTVRSNSDKLNPFAYVLPALLGMALLQLGLFGTATPILAARSRGTLVHLMMTPLPKWHLLSAHVFVRMAVAMIQLLVMLLIAKLWFQWPIDAGWPALLATLVLGALMLISLGALVAGIAPSELSGNYMVMLCNFVMLGVCDIFFATKEVGAMAWVSAALPLTYLSDATRQLVLGIQGRFPLWVDVAVMCGFTFALLGLAAKTFRFDMRKA